MIDHKHRPLGDIRRQVSDPFQIGIDLEYRRDAAQIDRYGLVQRQHFQAFLFDLHVAPINIVVAGQDELGEVRAALPEGSASLVNRFLDARRQRQNVPVKLFEIAFQVFHVRSPTVVVMLCVTGVYDAERDDV
jgi:hypothetical protein